MVLIGRFCIFIFIQNRELPYASARSGKPVKWQRYFDPSKRNKTVVMQEASLRSAGLFAASMYNESVKVD
jgi:hypothetical protein